MLTSIEEAQEQAEKAVHNQSLFAQDIKGREQEELDKYFGTIRLKNESHSVKGNGTKKPKKK